MRRLLGLGKPKSQPVAGDIACYGLTQWWLTAFNDQERSLIRRTYKPMGSTSGYAIDRGATVGCDRKQIASFLNGLSSWFRDRKHDRIQHAILNEAERHARTPLDRHFTYGQLIEYWYRLGDDRGGARDHAITYCHWQISLSKDAAKAWRKQHGHPLPSHVGFKQLAIINEKDGHYDEAIQLCRQAKRDGWAGDWDKRIARLEGKQVKRA